jgi:hypothetical protein
MFVDEGGGEVEWTNVTALGRTLLSSGPRDRHFAVRQDATGTLTVKTSADGVFGRVPPLGVDNVRFEYRVGAARDGNVGAGTVTVNTAGAELVKSATNPRPMYYSKPTLDPNNDKRIWLPGTYIVKSEDGGATFEEQPTSPTYDVGLKTDHHVIRVDPANSSHIYVVGDGGLHESFDMG